MTLLITGHEGYVGSGLLAYFRERGSIAGWGRRDDIASLTPQVLERLDITAVVNCATAMDRTCTFYDAASTDHRVNVEGTRAVVAASQAVGVPLIHISTKDVFGSVYGPDDLVDEGDRDRPKFSIGGDYPFRPQTVYAKSKLISEFFTESHPQAAVVRLATCYTDFFHHRGNWMMRMAAALLAGQPVTVTGTGKQCRDPLHVNDLGHLIERLLASRSFGIKVNAGGGGHNVLSVLDVIRMFRADADIHFGGGDSDRGFVCDNSAAKAACQWTPSICFADRVGTILANITGRKGVST